MNGVFRTAAIGAVVAAALASLPGLASAAIKETDCNADGQWFRTDSYYSAQTGSTWHVSEARLILESNNSKKNNALYHVRGANNDRTYFSWQSGDNFPGRTTVRVPVDTLAPRNQAIYVQGWVNADQTVDSKCWTPRGVL